MDCQKGYVYLVRDAYFQENEETVYEIGCRLQDANLPTSKRFPLFVRETEIVLLQQVDPYKVDFIRERLTTLFDKTFEKSDASNSSYKGDVWTMRCIISWVVSARTSLYYTDCFDHVGKDGMCAYIYLLYLPGEHPGDPSRFKVGQTQQKCNLRIKRLSQYLKPEILYVGQVPVPLLDDIETCVLRKFRDHFQIYNCTQEYFLGNPEDRNRMITIIDDVIYTSIGNRWMNTQNTLLPQGEYLKYVESLHGNIRDFLEWFGRQPDYPPVVRLTLSALNDLFVKEGFTIVGWGQDKTKLELNRALAKLETRGVVYMYGHPTGLICYDIDRSLVLRALFGDDLDDNSVESPSEKKQKTK